MHSQTIVIENYLFKHIEQPRQAIRLRSSGEHAIYRSQYFSPTEYYNQHPVIRLPQTLNIAIQKRNIQQQGIQPSLQVVFAMLRNLQTPPSKTAAGYGQKRASQLS